MAVTMVGVVVVVVVVVDRRGRRRLLIYRTHRLRPMALPVLVTAIFFDFKHVSHHQQGARKHLCLRDMCLVLTVREYTVESKATAQTNYWPPRTPTPPLHNSP